MARQRKRRRTKVVQLTPEILAKLIAADPGFAKYHAHAVGAGMSLCSFRTWSRRDDTMTIRAVWRRNAAGGVSTSIVYLGRYA